MAFNNASGSLASAAKTFYTAPADGALVTMIQVADKAGGGTFSVWWESAAALGTPVYLSGVNTPLGEADAISVVGGGLVLRSGDIIRGTSLTDDMADITICVEEQ